MVISSVQSLQLRPPQVKKLTLESRFIVENEVVILIERETVCVFYV